MNKNEEPVELSKECRKHIAGKIAKGIIRGERIETDANGKKHHTMWTLVITQWET